MESVRYAVFKIDSILEIVESKSLKHLETLFLEVLPLDERLIARRILSREQMREYKLR